MDGSKLAIDLTKLVADLAMGSSPLVLVKDIAEALYDQVGSAKTHEVIAALSEYARARDVKSIGFSRTGTDGPG